jgi:hypothetical protein
VDPAEVEDQHSRREDCGQNRVCLRDAGVGWWGAKS